MQVTTAKHCGFCYGVKRAVALALEEAAVSTTGEVYTLGPIIHNPQMVAELSAKGIRAVEDLALLNAGDTVIIRSHGIGPKIYEEAQHRSLKLADATCPHVKKAQQAAKNFFDAGYQVVVIGEARHPEVKGIVAWTAETALTVETVDEARLVSPQAKLGIVAQTTFCEADFTEIAAILESKSTETIIEKTICAATSQRQQAAAELARKVDLMIVIGGKNSANTTHLVDICRGQGAATLHIETADELALKQFRNIGRVGITAGASTPDHIIEEVLQTMQDFTELLEEHLKENKRIESGEIISGVVVAIRENDVFVDIGGKGEAVIELNELAYPTPEKAEDAVSIGEELKLLVLANGDGGIKLSRKRIQEKLAWETLVAANEKNELLQAEVTGVVKGGLRVAVNGISAFIPASHVALASVEDLNVYIGQKLAVYILDLVPEERKLVLSHKTYLRKQQEEQAQKTLEALTVGSDISGVVRRLTDFGAFVDLGGIDGLIHISDLSWQRVKSPAEILSVGDSVKVRILKVDAEKKRISLSLKDLQQDPWLASAAKLKVGMVVDVTVTRLAKFGAFVKVLEGVEGLIRLAELSEKHIHAADEAVAVGDTFAAKIIELEPSAKRLALSITQIKLDAERAEYESYLSEQKSEAPTLGDKFAHLLSQLEKK